MKSSIIAIEINKGGHTIGATVDAAQVASVYTVLSALLHGFNIRIVSIESRYVNPINHSADDIFRMVRDHFNVKISFQVFPLEKGGPDFRNSFTDYNTAGEMAKLWRGQFKTPYGISSKVE